LKVTIPSALALSKVYYAKVVAQYFFCIRKRLQDDLTDEDKITMVDPTNEGKIGG